MIFAALLLYFVLEYVRPSSYWPQLLSLHMNSIVPVATLLGNLSMTASDIKSRVFAERNTKLILGYVALTVGSVVTADVQERAWNVFVMVSGFAGIYWLMACEMNSVGRIKWAFMTLIGVHVVIAGLNPVLFTDPNNRHYIASGSFIGDGNDFALSVVLTVPLCLFLLFDSKIVMKTGWAVCLLLLIAGIVLTQSRGGTLGLMVMAAYYWFNSRKKVRLALSSVVIVGLVFAFAPPAYFERMHLMTDTEEGSAAARIEAWKAGTRMAIDHPIFGVGAGHFPIKVGNEYRTAGIVGSGMNAHSVYFQVLGELGLPGIALLLTLIGTNLTDNRRLARSLQSLATPSGERARQLLAASSATLVSFCTAGAFLSAAYYPHIFVVAGLLTSTRRVIAAQLVGEGSAAQAPAKPTLTLHPALRPRPVQPRLPRPVAGARG